MTAQEIYDRVRDHLLAQGRRSLVNEHGRTKYCAYRGADGLKCAVGCLITDESYTERMEGARVAALVSDFEALKPLTGHMSLLVCLQYIHDEMDVPEWKEALERLAIQEGLAP